MRAQTYNYFKKQVELHDLKDTKTLDVGSLDVNGSLRPLFTDYTGTDMRNGRNVDIVANAHNIPFDDETFDTVTCAEMLEHDDDPFQTMWEIHRVLKPNGWCILSAAGIGCRKHSYPDDYWRFTDSGMKTLLKKFKNIQTEEIGDGVYAIGQK